MRRSFLLLALAGCAPDLSGIAADLESIRKDVQQLKESRLGAAEALAITDKLHDEVQKLRRDVATLLTEARPPVLVGAPLRSGDIMGGTGGTQQGINDLYWVVSKVQTGGEDRVVLCLYRAEGGGRGMELAAVRVLNYDMQMIEMNSKPPVREVKKNVEDQARRSVKEHK